MKTTLLQYKTKLQKAKTKLMQHKITSSEVRLRLRRCPTQYRLYIKKTCSGSAGSNNFLI